MNKPPADFDLKFMPDWLKEQPAKNPYADYEVRETRERDRERGGAGDRGRGRGRDGHGRRGSPHERRSGERNRGGPSAEARGPRPERGEKSRRDQKPMRGKSGGGDRRG